MNYELNAVSIGYPTKVVAKGLSASLRQGELVCLVGRNGSGKSTLLRTMAAFQAPLSGSIAIVNDTDTVPGSSAAGIGKEQVHSLSPRDRARLIGIVLTEKPDIQNMTVREMVAMGRTPYTGFFGRLTTDDEQIIDESLALLAMSSFADRRMETLSDGERQKVMIAKALAQQTPFIFLDEPTAFLDYPSKTETMMLLQRLCREQDKAVLISTHDLDIALRYCDSVWHLHDGTLTTNITNATPSMFL